MSCTNCFSFECPECPESVKFFTSLTPNTDYYLHIENKQKVTIVKITSDGDGHLVLTEDQLVPAYFNRYNGYYTVRITAQPEPVNFETVTLCDSTVVSCFLLTFKKISGVQPQANVTPVCA